MSCKPNPNATNGPPHSHALITLHDHPTALGIQEKAGSRLATIGREDNKKASPLGPLRFQHTACNECP